MHLIVMIIGSQLLFFKDLPSTNSHAAVLLKENSLPEGTVIHTNFQTSGRGHAGNKWESEENKNLLISIVLYPSMIRPEDQFLLSMAISLGICDFLKHFISDISIKWPNDIYVNNDKIAGILIENSVQKDNIEHTIAGIGININQEKFLSDAPNPVSLSIITGRQYDLADCLRQLSGELDKRYKQLIAEDFDLLRRDYLSLLYRCNQWYGFEDQDGIFKGRITDVTAMGRLKVERENGTISEYSFKQIDFIT